jgi:peptidoglycan/xylan/chitin deacetylase (PgdA/CDA1 family)
VVVTFDDGYQDNFTVAYPILKKYEIPATIFVTTSFIGTTRTFWWDQVYAILRNARTPVFDNAADLLGIACPTQESFPLTTFTSRVHTAETIVDLLRTLPQEKRVASLERLQSMLGLKSNATANNSFMMTWAQLQEMSQNGITIESHTHTHPILSLTDADTAKKEFSTSKRLLEEQLDRAIHGVAYPDGREGTYNNATRKIAEAVGFRFGCSTERGRVGPGSDPFSLGRMPVGNVSLPVFVRNLLRTYGID